MQKTKPTREVSSIFCFAVCFLHGYVHCVPGEDLLTCFLYSIVCRVKTFNAIPYYWDKVYDPDPCHTAKLERLKRSILTEQNVLEQTDPNSTHFDSFPLDESKLFSQDFPVLPSFVPTNAFEQVKIQESRRENLQMLKLIRVQWSSSQYSTAQGSTVQCSTVIQME